MSLHTSHRKLAATATLGYLALTLLVAVLPAREIQNTPPLQGAAGLSAEAIRGRQIYLVEGCGFCHTQLVRDLEVDRPYGRPSIATDYIGNTPALLGTQRTGPDLSNTGIRQPSEVWHLLHLYDPRAVVPQSVMPAYPWYFERKHQADPGDVIVRLPASMPGEDEVLVATEEGLALVAYLLTLEQRELPQ